MKKYLFTTSLTFFLSIFSIPAIGNFGEGNNLDEVKEEYFVEITTLQNDDLTAICSIYGDDANLIGQETFISIEQPPSTSMTKLETVKNWLTETSYSLQKIKKKISYSEHMKEEWNDLSHHTFSENYLHLLGYYRDLPESGRTSYGEEVGDKVRITLINGILNLKRDINSSLQLLSDTHGNTVIHYVFRPTEGWSKDLCNSILAKFGYVSPYAKLLAAKWKEIIEELGGTESGGVIIHYAHSIGTTDTYMARSLLSPEEQKMIHVISFGSPSMIPKDSGFASSINYVSKRDGVCLFDPLGYIKGWFDEESNVEFLGSFLGIPFVDHMLSNESYDAVIRQLGLEFSDKYNPPYAK